MPQVTDVSLVKKRFSKTLARVCAGEEIVISVDGKPYARLIPPDEAVAPGD